MNLPFYIAKRYLFSKKAHNVINIISGISMVGVCISAFALIVVLSAFNGLQDLVESLYNSFDPDIKITLKEGKTFDSKTFPKDKIIGLEEVKYYTNVLEETALIKYKDKQSVATVKGVEGDFIRMSGMDTMIIQGAFVLEDQGQNFAVLGYGVADNLSVFIDHVFEPMKIYSAKRGKTVSYNPEQAFHKMNIYPSGIFSINPDFDMKYALVPFRFARKLLEYDTEVSAVEIGIAPEADHEHVKGKIRQIVGDQFNVKTQYEQNEMIFKANETEKWITFLILTFILVIASFNVIGSLTMLIIDKKDDIRILKSMGADKTMVRRIFLMEGLLINMIGGGAGLLIGGLLCKAQQVFGLVRLENVVFEYYPVKMELMDFGAIFLSVILIGFFASWFPARFVTHRHF